MGGVAGKKVSVLAHSVYAAVVYLQPSVNKRMGP